MPRARLVSRCHDGQKLGRTGRLASATRMIGPGTAPEGRSVAERDGGGAVNGGFATIIEGVIVYFIFLFFSALPAQAVGRQKDGGLS